MANASHPFASFGPAPYKLVGFQSAEERVQIAQAKAESMGVSLCGIMDNHKPKCGTTCDHCSTYIENVFTFRAADGATFKTGETCAKKANKPALSADDYATRAAARLLNAQINKVKLARKHANDAAKIAAANAWIGENREALDALPHPRGFEGQSFLDNLRWLFDNAGTTGKLKASRAAYKALGQKMPRLSAKG